MAELPIKPEPNSVVSPEIDVILFEYFWILIIEFYLHRQCFLLQRIDTPVEGIVPGRQEAEFRLPNALP